MSKVIQAPQYIKILFDLQIDNVYQNVDFDNYIKKELKLTNLYIPRK